MSSQSVPSTHHPLPLSLPTQNCPTQKVLWESYGNPMGNWFPMGFLWETNGKLISYGIFNGIFYVKTKSNGNFNGTFLSYGTFNGKSQWDICMWKWYPIGNLWDFNVLWDFQRDRPKGQFYLTMMSLKNQRPKGFSKGQVNRSKRQVYVKLNCPLGINIQRK